MDYDLNERFKVDDGKVFDDGVLMSNENIVDVLNFVTGRIRELDIENYILYELINPIWPSNNRPLSVVLGEKADNLREQFNKSHQQKKRSNHG